MDQMAHSNKKLTCTLTILLGMMITLVRVVLPTHVEITPGIVILETLLEIGITVAVVWLNRKELKEIFSVKFAKKDYAHIALFWVISYGGGVLIIALLQIIFAQFGIDYSLAAAEAPANIVGVTFMEVFRLGPILTICVTAPIVEEIVFRMTFRKVFKNAFLFVMVSSLLFGFIHTANFFTLGIIDYFFAGVLFALLYLKGKDVRKVIAAHMLYNIFITVMNLLMGA